VEESARKETLSESNIFPPLSSQAESFQKKPEAVTFFPHRKIMCSRVHFVMPRDQEAYRQSCEREKSVKYALQAADDAQYKRFLSTIPIDVLRNIVGATVPPSRGACSQQGPSS
jgi:hypothetical protein